MDLGSREVRARLDFHPFEISIKRKYFAILITLLFEVFIVNIFIEVISCLKTTGNFINHALQNIPSVTRYVHAHVTGHK